MNVTLNVATFYECDSLDRYVGKLVNKFDPMWRQTVTGCIIIGILRDMYKFNVSYVHDDPERNVTVIGEAWNTSFSHNDNIDVYARSISLRLDALEHAYPMLAINTWRFGFLLRRPDVKFFTTFYSKPFTRPVWNCLYSMALIISILFYLLKRWEYGILGGWEASFTYESLMVIGAYCQHIPPIDPKLPSRRIAYFIFFVFAYTVYTFYTSNLLSNLVNDKDLVIELETLAGSDYECVIVDYMHLAVSSSVQRNNYNFSIILNKLLDLRPVSVPEGLEALRMGQVALLSDYITIYPYIKKEFNNDEICKLISIDLFSNIKKYLFTSRDFAFKEQFRIGTLRIKESGILQRIVSTDFEEPHCTVSHLVQISLVQISIPLTVLIATYFVAVLILVVERVHFKRNKVWPYVE